MWYDETMIKNSRNKIKSLLENQGLVLDGAMATELEKLGVATDSALWSATALLDSPEKVYAVHKSYFQAGAQVATTNTYQANVPAFEKIGLSHEKSRQLISQAVEIAIQARDDVAPDGLVAASIGPYGAYLADGSEYTGAYSLSKAEFQDFHRERLELAIAAGANVLALETMPNFAEVQALVDLIENSDWDMPYWVSFSLKDSQTLCDGTPLAQAVAWVAQHEHVVAVGMNCLKTELATQALQDLHEVRALQDLPLLVYPNSGEHYDPVTKTWTDQHQALDFGQLAQTWSDLGAKLIGGCCRTSPQEISQIAQALK